MEKDKEVTMNRLMKAVEELLSEQGMKGIGVNKIAKKAGVDKKLIYRYFGSLEKLVEHYFSKQEYWNSIVAATLEKTNRDKSHDNCDLINFFLEKQFNTFYQDKMQRKILSLNFEERGY